MARPWLQEHGLAGQAGWERDASCQVDCSPFSAHRPLAWPLLRVPLCGWQGVNSSERDHMRGTQWWGPRQLQRRHHRRTGCSAFRVNTEKIPNGRFNMPGKWIITPVFLHALGKVVFWSTSTKHSLWISGSWHSQVEWRMTLRHE